MAKSPNLPEADFSFVRYANCWEDPELLLAALRAGADKRILSIASAGDNALTLLSTGAEVVAADLNPAQLACAELRKEAIRFLSRSEFLSFSGMAPSADRLSVYDGIKAELSPDSRSYWDQHQDALQKGFIHDGKFERYFHLFRKRILPLIHGKRRVIALLAPKSIDERKSFYEQHWNTRRWRLLFKLFFSRRMMGKHGRDPSFFDHVEGAVADRILERTRYALTELDPSVNPYLAYILTGNFGEVLPSYVEPVRYEAVKANIDRLILRHGAIDSVAAEFGPESFDGYNLSDIFEYLTPEQTAVVYERLLDSARPGARLAYWNMLVPRSCPAQLSDRVRSLDEVGCELFKQDRAFFYSRFVVEEVL